MTAAGIDPLGLQGRLLRARGWLEDYNGPSLELTHAVWLEILPPPAPDATLAPESNN